jgi:hypothetical protein
MPMGVTPTENWMNAVPNCRLTNERVERPSTDADRALRPAPARGRAGR